MHDALRRTLSWLLVVVAAGCAGPVQRTGDEYRHRRHGYVLATPIGPEGPWQRSEVEAATLAFRSAHGDTMIVKSRCGRPVAKAQLMARHLLIGLPERKVVEARPVEVAGKSAWLQIVDTASATGPVRLETITLVARKCSFDLILAAQAARFASVQPVFDAWWGSFRFVARERDA